MGVPYLAGFVERFSQLPLLTNRTSGDNLELSFFKKKLSMMSFSVLNYEIIVERRFPGESKNVFAIYTIYIWDARSK